VIIKGLKGIAKYLGVSRLSTVSEWRKKFIDFPVRKVDGRGLVADSDELKEWALRHGKIKPTTADELKIVATKPLKDPAQIMREIKTQARALRGLGDDDADDFLDMDVFNSYPEPTGDVEDELKAARKLRHYYERIIFSYKLDKLSDPKMVKVFQDFASGLTRQIAVIGRLEESLTKQRMRNGKLLDELTVLEWSRTFGDYVVEGFNDVARDLFDVVDEEVGAITADLDVDVALNSDKVLKLFDKRFLAERTRLAEGAVGLVKDFQDAQVARLGGEEDVTKEDDEGYE